MPTDQASPPGPESTVRKDLSSWWKNFKKGGHQRKEEEKDSTAPQGIFGVSLQQSVRYANVAISLSDANEQSYIYGYVPIVVAKCGVFLKEKATDVEGIFRLSGSEKRIKELRNAFNSPDRYGKGLDWTGYTVHDAANILRRYFNQLPEPIIPLDFYDKFREPLRNHQSQAVGPMEGQSPSEGDFNIASVIGTFQQLITQLPPLNRQLLLYILDLLAVFASKSDLNKMTTPNLAAIFQPGILSHPAHDMAPSEYRLSQDVLIFLIENQDHFLIGMQGTAADEKTVQEVESGPPTPQNLSAAPRHSKSTVVRSSSNSSKYSGVRRSVSASSRRSRNSVGAAPSPSGSDYQTPLATPAGTAGVHRSNTLPPSRSPNLTHGRFGNDRAQVTDLIPPTKEDEATGATPAAKLAVPPEKKPHTQGMLTEMMSPTDDHASHPSSTQPPEGLVGDAKSISATTSSGGSRVGSETLKLPPGGAMGPPSEHTSPLATPTGTSRAFATLFGSKSPTLDARQPKKLQKKRSPLPSAHSSTHSLHEPAVENVATPTAQNPIIPNSNVPPSQQDTKFQPYSQTPLNPPPPIGENLKPSMSPTTSYRSQSDAEAGINQDPPYIPLDGRDAAASEAAKKRNWFNRKGEAPPQTSLGTNGQAARSRSSILSGGEGRKSMTGEGRRSANFDRTQQSSDLTDPYSVTSDSERESRKGQNPISWFKGKVKEHQEKRDRVKEEKRVASPSRGSSTTASGTLQPESASMNTLVSTSTQPSPAVQAVAAPHGTENDLKQSDIPRLETVKEISPSVEKEEPVPQQSATQASPRKPAEGASLPSRPANAEQKPTAPEVMTIPNAEPATAYTPSQQQTPQKTPVSPELTKTQSPSSWSMVAAAEQAIKNQEATGASPASKETPVASNQ